MTRLRAWLAAAVVCAPVVGFLALSSWDADRTGVPAGGEVNGETAIFGPGCGPSVYDCETGG